MTHKPRERTASVERVFHVFGVEMRGRVAENGRRVLDEAAVEKLIEGIAGDADPGELEALVAWQRGSAPPASPVAEEPAAGETPWLTRLVGRLQQVEPREEDDFRPTRHRD